MRANKGGPLGALADAYVNRRVRGAFRGVWRRGVPTPNGPVLVYCNHTNFWDGFIAHQLCAAADWDGYCMMEEKNLRLFSFLGRLGAFSVRRDGAASLETLRYSRALLRQSRAAVFMFPEGELRPFGEWPLRFERGVEVIARTSKALCVPVALRYAFFEHEYPDVLVDVGFAHEAGSAESMRNRLEQLARGLEGCRSTAGFEQMVRGRTGVADTRYGGVTA